jgi:guanyl-specific ribonuclease Sa
MKIKKRTLAILVIILLVLAALWFLRGQTTDGLAQVSPQATSSLVELAGEDNAASPLQQTQPAEQPAPADETAPDENGEYTTKDDIAAYLIAYGKLPQNFITKSEARALGWSGGGLDDYDYGKCIGGDEFGNNEGLLPDQAGRVYYECDVDTLHQDDRGAKRIVFSSDGLIFYTDDHYESFTQLYPAQ